MGSPARTGSGRAVQRFRKDRIARAVVTVLMVGVAVIGVVGHPLALVLVPLAAIGLAIELNVGTDVVAATPEHPAVVRVRSVLVTVEVPVADIDAVRLLPKARLGVELRPGAPRPRRQLKRRFLSAGIGAGTRGWQHTPLALARAIGVPLRALDGSELWAPGDQLAQ